MTREQLLENKVRELREELDVAREVIRQLRRAMGTGVAFPEELGLSRAESRLLGILMGGDVLEKDAIITAMYSHKNGDTPGDGTINVHVYHLRKKLIPHGIAVTNVWGVGYRLPPESKLLLRRMMGAAEPAPDRYRRDIAQLLGSTAT